eukprot:CFRG1753T1
MLLKHVDDAGAGRLLFDAAEQGDQLLVEAQINSGADVNFVKDQTQQTPLYMAAYNGHYGIANLLLGAAATVDATNWSNKTPMHAAAAQGYESIVRLLVINGANVNAVDDEGVTPLHLAADSGKASVCGFLMSCQADTNRPNETGWTPLHYAAANGHHDVVKGLLQGNVLINLRDSDNLTPRDLAVEHKHGHIVQLIDSKGSNIESPVQATPPVVRSISTEQIRGLSQGMRVVEIETRERQLVLLRKEKENVETQLNLARQRLSENTANIKNLQGRLNISENTNERLRSAKENTEIELTMTNKSLLAITEQLEEMEAYVKNFTQQLEDEIQKNRESNLLIIEKTVAYQTLNEQHNYMLYEMEGAKSRVGELEAELKKLESVVARECVRCTELEGEINVLRSTAMENPSLGGCNQCLKLQDKIVYLKNIIDQANNERREDNVRQHSLLQEYCSKLEDKEKDLQAVTKQRDILEAAHANMIGQKRKDSLNPSNMNVRARLDVENDNARLRKELTTMTEMWEEHKASMLSKQTSDNGKNQDGDMDLTNSLLEALQILGVESERRERQISFSFSLPQAPVFSAQPMVAFLHSLPSYDRFHLLDKGKSAFHIVPQYTPRYVLNLMTTVSSGLSHIVEIVDKKCPGVLSNFSDRHGKNNHYIDDIDVNEIESDAKKIQVQAQYSSSKEPYLERHEIPFGTGTTITV